MMPPIHIPCMDMNWIFWIIINLYWRVHITTIVLIYSRNQSEDIIYFQILNLLDPFSDKHLLFDTIIKGCDVDQEDQTHQFQVQISQKNVKIE